MKKRWFAIMSLLGLLVVMPAGAAPESFTEHTIKGDFGGANSVYATDVDGDGDVDVLGAALDADDITWWENDGSESFTEHTIKGDFNGATSVYATDVDGDGDVDVLGAAYIANEITWWENHPRATRVYLPFVVRNYDPSPLFFDDFDDPASGWRVGSDGDVHFNYVDGEYEIYMGLLHGFTHASAPIASMTGDYSVEADVRRLDGDDSACGLVFENPESWDAYWFTVSPQTQQYHLWLSDAGELTELTSGSSSYIHSGDATNHLKVERSGGDIAISANGHLLATITDTTHQGGNVGVTEWGFDDVPAIGRFDNFEVRRLGGGSGGFAVGQGRR